MALIVIEGCDGAGKSTLIEKLRNNSQRYFVVVRSAGPPPDHGHVGAYVSGVLQLALRIYPYHVICDRFQPISESIYAPVVRNQEVSFARDTLLSSVDRIVYCRPQLEVILDQLQREEQMAGVPERAKRIIEAYDRLFEKISHDRSKPPVFYYDYAIHSVAEVACWLELDR